MMRSSALYFGEVVHLRLRPFRHRFRYGVFSLFLDLDEIPSLAAKLTVFSHNRFNLFSFRDRDHGPLAAGDAERVPLRSWVERQLSAAGIQGGGPIKLLCFPRFLGYVFNPLSVFFCYDQNERLAAVLYEVNNTFGERHSYLLPVSNVNERMPIEQICAKQLYVSPFIGMEAQYRFNVMPPGERLALTVNQEIAGGPQLVATHTGHRRKLTDGNLIAAFFRYPLMTLKVIGAIHWEALRLWRKGAKLVPRPAPSNYETTFTDLGGREKSLGWRNRT